MEPDWKKSGPKEGDEARALSEKDDRSEATTETTTSDEEYFSAESRISTPTPWPERENFWNAVGIPHGRGRARELMAPQVQPGGRPLVNPETPRPWGRGRATRAKPAEGGPNQPGSEPPHGEKREPAMEQARRGAQRPHKALPPDARTQKGHKLFTGERFTCANCFGETHYWQACPKPLRANFCRVCRRQGTTTLACPDGPHNPTKRG